VGGASRRDRPREVVEGEVPRPGPACRNLTRAHARAAVHDRQVLFVLGGSSGAGKSAIRRFLLGEGAALVAGLRLRSHDFDEDGVPPDADSSWRQQTGAAWVQRALECERLGEDLLLSANWPLGEILASPGADLLDGVAVCLVDCADPERVERLRARDHASYTDERIWDFVVFAAWQRLHHANPQWMPEVILDHWPEMVWQRWRSWLPGDPRWSVPVFDTSGEPVEASASRVAAWIREQSKARDRGELALRRGNW